MVEAERRERRSLGLIAQVSDLLMDVDDPHALREIAAILRRSVVGWAAFYLNDGGLRVADGIDAGHPPTGKGSRHGEGPAVRDAGPDAVQQLLDAETRPAGRAGARRLLRARERVGVAGPAGRGRPGDAADAAEQPLGRWSSRCRAAGACSGVLAVHAHDGHGLRDLEPSVRTVLDLTARRVGHGHRQRAPLRPRAPAGRDAAARDAAGAGRGRRARRVDVLRAELGERPGGRRLVRRAPGQPGRGRRRHRGRRRARRRGGRRRWVSCARWSAPTSSTSRRPARCSSGSTSWSRACGCRARRASSCRP